MFVAILLFVIAGVAEIGGGYLVWLWLRESKPVWYGVVGSLVLIPTALSPLCRCFRALAGCMHYGGVFVVLAVLWGWVVDKKAPDHYDWIGAAVCVAGVCIMLWAPRN